jgi:hypothetical protein
VFIVALGMSSVFILGVFLSQNHSGSGDSNGSVGGSANADYEFKVYALNTTAMTRAHDSTAFLFSISDLPFDFNSISFGDVGSDANHSRIYYAGSGILVNATGKNATVTLRESNGRTVSSIDYGGQEQIVFNGEVKSVTYPSLMTTYSGTDLMVQDWRNGIWAPNDGILVEHPNNVTVDRASFFLMVLESGGTFEIPEFGNVVPSVLASTTLVVALLLIGRRRSLEPKGIELDPSNKDSPDQCH